MYVCLCKAVTSSTVSAAIAAGATTVETVGEHCAAGTGCGRCHHTIQILLDEHRQEARDEPDRTG